MSYSRLVLESYSAEKFPLLDGPLRGPKAGTDNPTISFQCGEAADQVVEYFVWYRNLGINVCEGRVWRPWLLRDAFSIPALKSVPDKVHQLLVLRRAPVRNLHPRHVLRTPGKENEGV